ncbi:phage tail tube protein [Rufibacter sp. LB8]|uniref:phage tail tube protein n=1 Tax=Rufibacter sp. LB8 TaxID=2777781 RepID=UPI00178C76F1|nr:phage tail tube protein [Rufibacter sp. LB8]
MPLNEIQSKELAIEYNGKIIARATSFSLEISREEIDVTTLDSGGWSKKIGGMKNWSASTDALVLRGTEAGKTEFHELFTSMVGSDNPVSLILSSDVTGDKCYRGNALITSLSQSGSLGEVMTYSVSFSGSDELIQETVPAPLP